jgi:hypothetical protein
MAGIQRGLRYEGMKMRQIVSSGNVKSGFIPEERQVQQRSMKHNNRHEDDDEELKSSQSFRKRSWFSHAARSRVAIAVLVNGAGRRGDIGIQLDLAKRILILMNILLQDGDQRFGLLRAEINALKVMDLNFLGALRLQASKDQKKVPNAHAHLHGVGIAVTVLGRVQDTNIGLRRN